MRPNGRLRESIEELAEESGAYFIASSDDYLSDSSLNG
jgi:rRNA-processing protein FCF1